MAYKNLTEAKNQWISWLDNSIWPTIWSMALKDVRFRTLIECAKLNDQSSLYNTIRGVVITHFHHQGGFYFSS